MSSELTAKLWRTIGTRIRDIDELDDGVRVCVVKSEEADNVVSDVLVEAARSTGATVTRHEYPTFDSWKDTFRLPESVHQAIRECDWLLSHSFMTGAQFMWCHSVVGAQIDCGVNHLSFFGSAEALAGPGLLWPDELSSTIADKIVEDVLAEDQEIHVTSDNGTDFTFYGRSEWSHPTPGLETNAFLIYPQAEAGWHPYETGDGRLVFEAMNRYGYLHEPIEWHVEDGDIVDITGGAEADHFDNWVWDVEGGDDLMLTEVAFGYNPKCRWNTDDPSLAEPLFKAGTVHCAVGMSPMKWAPSRTKKTHIDAMMTNPTVEVGDTILIDDGDLVFLDRMREDQAVRDVASKYGDPDELLISQY